MSARRYTLTVRADDYALMESLCFLAELIPGAETSWYVATDEALERARLADELFPVGRVSQEGQP